MARFILIYDDYWTRPTYYNKNNKYYNHDKSNNISKFID